MDSDCYKVEILHYINPHLIWVEAKYSTSDEDFVFEQLGIYGLLPSEITIDIDGSEITSQNNAKGEWAPAAAQAMAEALHGAKAVYFRPTFIDRRCSKLRDIHKFGDIIIKRKDGISQLSDTLIESRFAFLDICLFHQQLSLGNIKTTLNEAETRDVIRYLENKCPLSNKSEKKIKKMTTVFQEVQNMEPGLTTKNLEMHNRQFREPSLRSEYMETVEDAEGTLGRANKRKSSEKKLSSLLQRKLDLSNRLKYQDLHVPDPVIRHANSPPETPQIKEVYSEETEIQSEEISFVLQKKTAKKAKKTPKSKIPEYDAAKEARVAYGPPGVNPTDLLMKVIPIRLIEEEKDNLTTENDNRKEIIKDVQPFDKVDSDLNYTISNRKILKDINTHQNTDVDVASKPTETKNNVVEPSPKLTIFQKKLALHNERMARKPLSPATSVSDSTLKDTSTIEVEENEYKLKSNRQRSDKNKTCDYLGSDEDVSSLAEHIHAVHGAPRASVKMDSPEKVKVVSVRENSVNPFKNIDDSISVFVDKLVTPVLMVHTKRGKRITPTSNVRDVAFNTHIHVVLKNMLVERPMMIQMVSWPVILRGNSLFMVSPLGSGKTLGYLPAICRLVTDYSDQINSVGPICIIVCATAQSVTDVENYARMFLGIREKVISCYAGMDEMQITTSLLNGCDLFICTPWVLIRLMQQTDFGIDLRRLSVFVIEDGERLGQVYSNELKYFLVKIREMYKSRSLKEHMVQFVVASRVWCDFMESLARKAPNSVVCIGAFQECVLYSKAKTSVEFVTKDKKVTKVLDFLKHIDTRKRTVIVCREDNEVAELEQILMRHKYVVFACNSTMTLEDLYNLSITLSDYDEPLLGPILICCDGNLTHLNVTNANYLIHYTLPALYSMFCKRFSVLNDNYSSIFQEYENDVNIKVLVEDTNVEQLPKIMNFIKRCTSNVPEFLDEVCEKILKEKDAMKAKNLVPVCDNLLTLGECPDIWSCVERHAIFKEYDQPKKWLPRDGIVTFKILHYHSAVRYSVRLLSNSTKGNTVKYPQAYSTLSLKMGLYFSKESNQKLHGIPKVGDICAVSIKQNFFARCQVLKILSHYDNGTPSSVLIKLVDEEKLEKTKDIYLFHLPQELINIETHVAEVRLANIRPKDKDITFSQLASNQLKKITDQNEDLYMRGHVVMTIGQCLFVDTLDACQDLTSLNEHVVIHNFKKELLERHGDANDEHISKLKAQCDYNCEETTAEAAEIIKEQKPRVIPQWAYLSSDLSTVLLSHIESPATFFVRLTKFESCMRLLVKDIDKYVELNPLPVTDVKKGDLVLAKYPDENAYERARVDDVLDENKVRCFSVDQGDSRDVLISDLLQIPDKFVTLVPFQAIECKLLAVKPVGDCWTEFATNWFSDKCYEDENGKIKQLYIKYYSKEDAEFTQGKKYSVALIDTTTNQDEVINELMIDLNLARAIDEEIHYLDEFISKEIRTPRVASPQSTFSEDVENEDANNRNASKALIPATNKSCEDAVEKVFLKPPIRSVPLVDPDDEFTNRDWDIVKTSEMIQSLFPGMLQKINLDLKDQESSTNSKMQKNEAKGPIVGQTHNYSGSVIEIASDASNTHPETLAMKENQPKAKNVCTNMDSVDDMQNLSTTLDSDDLSSAESSLVAERISKSLTENELRKPKLVWHQNKATVSIKIQLVGADDYQMEIKERSLKFAAYLNDTHYGFNFELYGVVDDELSTHSNKGQYILIKLVKIMKKNWLTLTREGGVQKWIVYDVDSIDTSSDEEDTPNNQFTEAVKQIHYGYKDSDSDDDFLDDVKRDFD